MPVRILNQSEVESLLTMDDCIHVMEEALTTLAEGDAIQPLRSILRMPNLKGAFGVMPGVIERPAAFGLKAISVYPANHGTEYDSHQGAVLLFEPVHGSLAAILDASSITAIRTAAVSGVATILLARRDAGDLAILGSGVQADTHLDAMRAVRDLRRVRTWSRNTHHATDFAKRARSRHGLAVEVMPTAQAAVTGADLICTVTGAKDPILAGEWIMPGAHINAVGSSMRDARELDTAAVVRSRLFVDRRESALHEAGDFLIPRAEGAVTDAHILGELGDLLLNRATGREGPADITLFKSLGLAIEDVAVARHVCTMAQERGVGLVLDLGGQRGTHP